MTVCSSRVSTTSSIPRRSPSAVHTALPSTARRYGPRPRAPGRARPRDRPGPLHAQVRVQRPAVVEPGEQVLADRDGAQHGPTGRGRPRRRTASAARHARGRGPTAPGRACARSGARCRPQAPVPPRLRGCRRGPGLTPGSGAADRAASGAKPAPVSARPSGLDSSVSSSAPLARWIADAAEPAGADGVGESGRRRSPSRSGSCGERQDGPSTALDVQHQGARDEHDDRAGLAAGPVPPPSARTGDPPRPPARGHTPGRAPPPPTARRSRRTHAASAGAAAGPAPTPALPAGQATPAPRRTGWPGRSRRARPPSPARGRPRPGCPSRRSASSSVDRLLGVRAQLVDRPGQRELRPAEVLDEVAATHLARLLERGEHLVDQAELPRDALRRRDRPGQHPVPVEQLGRQRVRSHGRVGLPGGQHRPAAAGVVPRDVTTADGGRDSPGRSPSRAPRSIGRARGAAGPRAVGGARPAPAAGAEAGPQRAEPVVGEVPRPDEVPDRRRDLALPGSQDALGVVAGGRASPRRWSATRAATAGTKYAPPSAEHRQDRAVQGRVDHAARLGLGERGQREIGRSRGVQAHHAVVRGQLGVPGPHDLAGGGELVEHGGGVVDDPGGQHERLQRRRRHHRPGELLDRPGQPVDPAQAPDALPPGQEDARAPAGRPARPRPAARPATGAAGCAAPRCRSTPRRCPRAPRDAAGRTRARPPDSRRRSTSVATAIPIPYRAGDLRGRERAPGPGVPAHEVAEGVGHDLGEDLGHADRQGDAERVTQASGVLDRRPLLGPVAAVVRRGRAGQTHPDEAPCPLELGEPLADLVPAPRDACGPRPRRS